MSIVGINPASNVPQCAQAIEELFIRCGLPDEPIALQDIRNVCDGRLMANCGYDRDQAESAATDGLADLVAFGRPFISNPDLVERFANDWDLNDFAPQKVWYSPGKKGYTDFPTHQESETSPTAFAE